MNLWQAAADCARRNEGALATVAATSGSTPVPAGTKMLVGADGRLAGTVGGGCVEADALTAVAEVRRLGRPALLTHHLNADLAGDLGLSCGGTVHIFVEPLIDAASYVEALEAAAGAERGCVSTATDWAAGPDKLFTTLPPGAPAIPAAEVSTDRQRVIERFTLPPRVLVFGAGHVGAAIARVANAAGFRVTVVDDRADFADPARFAGDVTVWASDPDDAVARFAITPDDAVVVATRGHRHDAEILDRVAPSGAGYVGLLGSRRKKIVITKGLTGAGVPADALERVRVPVGIDIGAETPEEIAVSVVAELIAWRRRGRIGDTPSRTR